MRAAISAKSPPLGAALRGVLSEFHAQKRMAGVEALLCRLYEPILYRAFGAANALLRRNALLLLLDAFPIRVRGNEGHVLCISMPNCGTHSPSGAMYWGVHCLKFSALTPLRNVHTYEFHRLLECSATEAIRQSFTDIMPPDNIHPQRRMQTLRCGSRQQLSRLADGQGDSLAVRRR
jgi:hypothetical protein